VLDADALGGVFGIEMDDGDGEVAEVAPLSSTRKQAARKKPAQKKAVKKKAAKKRAVQKKTAKKQAAQPRPAKKAAARKKAAFRATPAAVRGLRAALGHSRAEFARALGVSAATVGNWENANRPLQLQAGSLAALRRLNRNRPG